MIATVGETVRRLACNASDVQSDQDCELFRNAGDLGIARQHVPCAQHLTWAVFPAAATLRHVPHASRIVYNISTTSTYSVRCKRDTAANMITAHSVSQYCPANEYCC